MAAEIGGGGTQSDGQAATSLGPLDERYYVRGETEAYGPYQGHMVKQMIGQGKLLPGTGIARVGATEWVEIKDHPFFASLLQSGHAAAGSGQVPGAYAQAGSEPRRYAGFWIRFVAYMVDFIVIMIGYGIIMGIVFATVGPDSFKRLSENSNPAGQSAAIAGLVVAYVATFVFVILYQVLFLRSRWQATPGKRLLGLRVITESGLRVSGLRALGRYFAYILSALPFYIGFMMIGWTEQKKGLHDMVCETRVVYSKR